MIFERSDTPGARFLLMGASLVIVVAGLREGATILLPFALALFLAVMSMPLMFWLQLRRVPSSLAIILTMLVMGAVFGALIMLGTQAVADLQDQLPGYQARSVSLYTSWDSAGGISYLRADRRGLGRRFLRQNRRKSRGLLDQHFSRLAHHGVHSCRGHGFSVQVSCDRGTVPW